VVALLAVEKGSLPQSRRGTPSRRS
jgi:hypothetical protein